MQTTSFAQPTIDSSNINERVYFLLKKSIINGSYTPAIKLNIDTLREEFGVSYTPIKDALSRLAGEGLIEIRSRKGTFVRNISKKEVIEIIDTRLLIEPSVVQILATQITDKQLKILEDDHDKKMSLTVTKNMDLTDYIENDFRFHLDLISFMKNDTLFQFYKRLNDHMQIVRYRFSQETEHMAWVLKDHRDIITALKKRKPIDAAEAMKSHLMTSKEEYTSCKLA